MPLVHWSPLLNRDWPVSKKDKKIKQLPGHPITIQRLKIRAIKSMEGVHLPQAPLPSQMVAKKKKKNTHKKVSNNS